MLAGHVAVGLLARRARTGLSLGTLVFAALLADLLVFVFVLTGIERIEFLAARGAANYFHPVDIAFSHSLAANLIAGAALGAALASAGRSRRAAAVAAMAVASHWLLDVLSHRPDMPLAPFTTSRWGLGLWTSVPATLVLEGGLWITALYAYWRTGLPATVGRRIVFVAGALLITVAWIGNVAGPPPSDPQAAPLNSLIFFGLIIGWAYWVDRRLRAAARTAAAAIGVVVLSSPAFAQTPARGDTYRIERAKGPIIIDGDLSDEGWRGALRVDRWYEMNPGDNTEPAVKNVGFLTYDDKFLYAAFEFEDPDPTKIVAPFGDHDNIQSNADFGGLFLDPRNEAHTAYEFQVTAHNVQFDAVLDDNGGGENASPDFFWQSATHINDHGWTLEMRIPFSSLRYRRQEPQEWGVMLWRNYARDFRYQFTSVRQPRGSQCFICREGRLTGLSGLPGGGHLVAAPYVAANQTARPSGELGTPLVADPADKKIGLDVKYTPNADNTLDATIRPDFSQIEADTAQIATNERFALFFPEKRPFFLEGVELFSTPIQAVYTRTITAPDWGGRATGKLGGVSYTALVADDAGGGSVIVPGPESSSLAEQDFDSTVFIGRVKKDFGLSFVGALVTDRESGADGHNRVAGPDVQVRFKGTETVTGQFLVSDTKTPNRPDVSAAWTGAALQSGAGQVGWNHSTEHFDASATYKEFGTGFRADNGYLPQVGYREQYVEPAWTFRPKGFVSRVRTWVTADRQAERDSGAVVFDSISSGVHMDTKLSGAVQLRYERSHVRAQDVLFGRHQFQWFAHVSPSRRFQNISSDGFLGQEVDFENVRRGRGGRVNLDAQVNATDHLVFDLIHNTTWVDVDDAAGVSRPLFTARVSRVRANYTFTARSFVRLIGQYLSTDRNRSLFLAPTAARDGFFSGSALFAYKINWQSVMFFGYGDDRTLDEQRRLRKSDRQLFVKLSYAFQR